MKKILVSICMIMIVLAGCSSSKNVTKTCIYSASGNETKFILEAKAEDKDVTKISLDSVIPFAYLGVSDPDSLTDTEKKELLASIEEQMSDGEAVKLVDDGVQFTAAYTGDELKEYIETIGVEDSTLKTLVEFFETQGAECK